MITTILTFAKLGNEIFLKDFHYLTLKSTFPTFRVDSIKNLMIYALIECDSNPSQTFAIMCFSSFLSHYTMCIKEPTLSKKTDCQARTCDGHHRT